MPAADEQQLIRQSRDGDHDAFRVLVERYMKQTYNVAYGFVRDHDDAEEITQDTFIRAHRSLASFRGDAELGTWLYRIAVNLSLNCLNQRKRKAQRELITSEVMGSIGENSTDIHHSVDSRAHIERALHELPTLQRAVVILRHLDGLSTKQVSGLLRCSEGTVKTHLHRGLKKMRKILYYMKDGEE